MHIEFLVEDSSGALLIKALLPLVLGPEGTPHTWRIHKYKGVGHLPQGLGAKADPAKRALMNQLPRLLSAYGKTPGYENVVVVLDSDRRNCQEFLAELQAVLTQCTPAPRALFRLAIEEMEAWLLGDRQALLRAYPKAKRRCWHAMCKTVFAVRGSCWPMPFIRAGTRPSTRQAGPCPDRSSTCGSRTLPRTWTCKPMCHQVLANFAMDCAAWRAVKHEWHNTDAAPGIALRVFQKA